MAVGLFVWSTAYALAISSVGASGDMWWTKVSYLGIVFMPVAWFVFCAEYSGATTRFGRREWVMLLVVPAITIVLVFTDGWHHLVWQDLRTTPGAGTPAFSPGFSTWFWVHTAYSYGVLLFGAALLVRMAIRSRRLHRTQTIVILVGLALPLVANVLYLADLQPRREIDMTPFVLSISCLLFAIGLLRFRILDIFVGLVPVARDAAIEGMADGVVVVDAAGRVADVNPAAVDVFDLPAAAIIGQSATQLAIGGVNLGDLFSGAGRQRAQATVDDGEGRRHFDLLASEIGHEESGHIVVIRDMTSRRKAELALSESEARYRALFENATDFVFTLKPDGRVESANGAALTALGYTNEELQGANVSDLVPVADVAAVVTCLEQVASVAPEGVFSLTLVAKDGHEVEIETSLSPLTRDGEIVAIQGIARDVTERTQWETVLRYQALHDNLTELPNRTLLYERMNQAIGGGRGVLDEHALLIIDLDRFKEVNDTYGHHVGDVVLHELSTRFQAMVRSTDTIARLGGDEFAVFMPNASASAAGDGAQRILRALEAPVEVDDMQFELQASVGIATYPDHGTDAHSLLRSADVAMYVAKRSGESPRLYSQQEDPHSVYRLHLLSRLREALRANHFTLHYQPIVDVRRRRLVAVEALARWQDDELSGVGPSEFIPLMEETGLILPFTLWLVGEVVRQIAAWQEHGYEVAVSINLSARNLHDHQVLETLQALCLEHGVEPSLLTIEVTEGSIMTDPQRARETLARLSELGVSVAVDDFGTGYSSLAYLQRLPVTHLKIERSFVQRMATDTSDAAIVRSTIGLGQDLGLKVVAEGVEDEASLDMLGGLGCDAAQGFHIARPMPAAAVLSWLEARPEAHGKGHLQTASVP